MTGGRAPTGRTRNLVPRFRVGVYWDEIRASLGAMALLEGVLPLVTRDFPRFSLLARSLVKHFPDLGRLHVVLPDGVATARADELRRLAHGLELVVVAESAWVPELASFRHLSGWYKQQILKLAAAEHLNAPFFITFDADVVCTRPVTVADLVRGGKAPCFVIDGERHADWYDGAEAALELRAVRRGILHNVTPAVWARDGILEVLAHLDDVARARRFAPGLRGVQQRLLFGLHHFGRRPPGRPWRAWLAASAPWAEYALYFTSLAATGRFDRYHFASDFCIYDVERSLWWAPEDFDAWDPSPLFEGKGPPYFAVIQSNARLEPRRVSAKLEPLLA